jgi:hypothetical protein
VELYSPKQGGIRRKINDSILGRECTKLFQNIWEVKTMKRQIKTAVITAIGTVSVLGATALPALPAFAATQTTNTIPQSISTNNIQSFTPSTQAQQFVNYMLTSGLIKEFTLDSNGQLSLKESLSSIQQQYHLDATSMQELQQVMSGAQRPSNTSSTIGVGHISPQLSYSNGIVYFSHSDVQQILYTAASIGPAAVAAALEAFGTLTGGPIGTLIVTIIAIIGAPSLINFTYDIIQAEFNNEGVYIGVQFNGGFPNIVTGTWG